MNQTAMRTVLVYGSLSRVGTFFGVFHPEAGNVSMGTLNISPTIQVSARM